MLTLKIYTPFTCGHVTTEGPASHATQRPPPMPVCLNCSRVHLRVIILPASIFFEIWPICKYQILEPMEKVWHQLDIRWGGGLTEVSRRKEPNFGEKEILEQEQTRGVSGMMR